MTAKAVWDTYSEDIKHFILSKVKDETVSDDLLQETFIKVHTKLHTLKDDTKLKSWLFSVAKYSILDYYRSKKPTEVFDNYDELNDELQPSSHTEKDCLRGILINLPKKYRDPIFMSDIMGLKQADVAKRLGLTLSAVKSQIQRARKLIAKGYMDCCGYTMNTQGYLVGEIQDRADCKVCN